MFHEIILRTTLLFPQPARRDLASNLGETAFVLSKIASVRVGSGLFEQAETLKGVGLSHHAVIYESGRRSCRPPMSRPAPPVIQQRQGRIRSRQDLHQADKVGPVEPAFGVHHSGGLRQGGFKWLSQHPLKGSCDAGSKAAVGSVGAGAPILT